MFRPLPFVLILVLMLTSIGLGVARGQVRLGTEVVLCTGHGVVVTRLPDGGGGKAHLCPDMALSLLAAVNPADVLVPPRVAVPGKIVLAPASDQPPARQVQVRVRGPPAAMPA
ncbi:hypothetical protein [Paracoccus sp. (in: a-proteobacteria)]|uniref:hypothetical protein n=1 Tax=Paracoccus sp. TaxID=267 RepID=UPI00396C3D62